MLLLHHFVYTTQKYAYLPLQPPIMTCITLKGGSWGEKKTTEINDLMAASSNITCLTPSHQKVTSHISTLLCFY